MQVIYKYLANTPSDITILKLPIGSKILTVQKQGQHVCFWVLQPSEEVPTMTVRILKVGTGHPFDDTREYKYIGTVQEWEGSLIWHYFEVR